MGFQKGTLLGRGWAPHCVCLLHPRSPQGSSSNKFRWVWQIWANKVCWNKQKDQDCLEKKNGFKFRGVIEIMQKVKFAPQKITVARGLDAIPSETLWLSDAAWVPYLLPISVQGELVEVHFYILPRSILAARFLPLEFPFIAFPLSIRSRSVCLVWEMPSAWQIQVSSDRCKRQKHRDVCWELQNWVHD